jgi:glycosyltransferase involved in cell wall biosynthesis
MITNVCAIILTRNEAIHLPRCLASLHGIVSSVLIVDCGSDDDTRDIATNFGAHVVSNSWLNYASQFNFGVSQLNSETEWVMRIDADEYLTPVLRESLRTFMSADNPHDLQGVYFPRRMAFMGRIIKYGGIFPARMLRLFRVGKGQIENRWMDEHIKVEGKTVVLEGELIDDNLNSLTWWTDKHNKYASREAVDLLNLEFQFMKHDSVASAKGGSQAGLKRWIKEKIYARLPSGLRALAYFMYRYVLRLGFLDGKEGTMFHFLQGFWYRYLVDCKVYEVKRYMRTHQCDVRLAIEKVLDIRV